MECFQKLAAATPEGNNFNMLLTHTPIHAVVVDGKDEKTAVFIGYNNNLRKALYEVPEYKPVVAFAGHMHWYQRWQSKRRTQFVLGNSGTKLLPKKAFPLTQGLPIYFSDARNEAGEPYDGKVIQEFGRR